MRIAKPSLEEEKEEEAVQEDPVAEEEKTPEDRKVAEQHRTEVLELSSRIGELDIESGNQHDKIAHLQEMQNKEVEMM